MKAVDELNRKALLHDQAALLLRSEPGHHERKVEHHSKVAARLRKEAAWRGKMISFIPSRNFRRNYDRLFLRDPAAANLILLLSELADQNGQVRLGPCPEEELQTLMAARFSDCWAYQLSGGPKR